MSAEKVYNLIRALIDPYPNAFSYFNGKKISFVRAELLKNTVKGIAGRIPLKRKNGVVAISKDKGLLITGVKIENDDTEYNPKDVFPIGSDFSDNP